MLSEFYYLIYYKKKTDKLKEKKFLEKGETLAAFRALKKANVPFLYGHYMEDMKQDWTIQVLMDETKSYGLDYGKEIRYEEVPVKLVPILVPTAYERTFTGIKYYESEYWYSSYSTYENTDCHGQYLAVRTFVTKDGKSYVFIG